MTMKVLSYGTLVLLLQFVSLQLLAQAWEITTLSPMPEPVSNNAVVEGFVNGKAYVYSFAGLDSTKVGSTGAHLKAFRYDVELDQWETLPDLPDPDGGKVAASANRIGNIIYIVGGYHILANGSEISSNLVHRFDITTNQYLSNAKDIPLRIDDQVQGVWRDSLLYVVTGWSGNAAAGTNTPNTQIYNPSTDSWSFASQMPNTDDYKSFGSAGYILGDTIFYFGGAASSCCMPPFPIQNQLRKGVINPENPQSITWSIETQPTGKVGYRMAARKVNQSICWFGGSGDTYNYNGLSYLDDSGVAPLNRILSYTPISNTWEETLVDELPMDLRGIAVISPTLSYLAGGMLANQQVSDKLYRLTYLGQILSQVNIPTEAVLIFPNPVRENVQITLPQQSQASTYQISNTFGQILLEGPLLVPTTTINLSHLPNGNYQLQIRYPQQYNSYKLLKIKP